MAPVFKCAQPGAASARTLGRDPSGDVRAREFFDKLGREAAEDGIEDAPQIFGRVQQLMASKYSATTVKLLRSKCNHLTLRESFRAAEVEEDRWAGLIELLADHLALDFVTPPQARGGERAIDGWSACSTLVPGSGGIRDSVFLEKGGETLSVKLMRSGELYDTQVFREDFQHLNLSLVIEVKHVKLISKATAEAVVSRRHSINWGASFEDVLDRDLTALFGACPERKGKGRHGRKGRTSFEDDSGDEDSPRRTWSSVMHWLPGNLRKSNAKASIPPHPPTHSDPLMPHGRDANLLPVAGSLFQESPEVVDGRRVHRREDHGHSGAAA